MDPEHQEVIRRQSIYLLDHLIIDVKFLTCLFRDRILSDDQLDQLTEVNHSSKRINLFCTIIRRRGPRAFQGLIAALNETEQDFIAQHLLSDLESQASSNISNGDGLDIDSPPVVPVPDDKVETATPTPSDDSELSSPVRRFAQDPGLLKELVEACIYANNIQENGTTVSALQVAVDRCQTDLVTALLDAGCSVGIVDEDGETLLHRAARTGSIAIVKALLSFGVDPNATATTNNRTPLHIAILAGHSVTAMYLIEEAKVDIHIADHHKKTALYFAAQLGSVGLVQLLIDGGADLSSWSALGRSPLHEACFSGHAEVVKLILDSFEDPDDPQRCAVDIDGRTPLHWACLGGYRSVVKVLVEYDACVNVSDKDGETPLHVASRWGMLNIALCLLERDAYVLATDNNQRTPLHDICTTGNLEMAKLLVDRGADCNAEDDHRRTPLHLAACQGREDVCKLLLESGARVNAADGDKRTALHGACVRGNSDVAALLVQKGADVTARDNGGRVPLHEACIQGQRTILNMLLKNSSTVCAKTDTGMTPLHFAVLFNHVDLIPILLRHGASPDDQDDDGATPLSLSADSNKEIKDLLRWNMRWICNADND